MNIESEEEKEVSKNMASCLQVGRWPRVGIKKRRNGARDFKSEASRTCRQRRGRNRAT